MGLRLKEHTAEDLRAYLCRQAVDGRLNVRIHRSDSFPVVVPRRRISLSADGSYKFSTLWLSERVGARVSVLPRS